MDLPGVGIVTADDDGRPDEEGDIGDNGESGCAIVDDTEHVGRHVIYSNAPLVVLGLKLARALFRERQFRTT